ncbi:MAG: alpha-1,2-fucosyltransferase, partial [Myxococcota bacterium]|nr:alpha-1,2-fucosyltransferase [Myxococcota bacterium]
FRVRIGPLLRHERDKRRYESLFRPPGWRQRVLRSSCLLSFPRRCEPAVLDDRPVPGALYWFAGQGSAFAPLLRDHALLGEELRAIVRPEFLPGPENRPFIAVHVRRGDFSMPSSTELARGQHNFRIPIDWYVAALRSLRNSLGRAVAALVFSDGTERELEPLLAERFTTMSRSKHAASDLLKMSEAGALIASGSTFSMWASFLGQVPAIWYPGQRRELLLREGPGAEPEWSAGPFQRAFLDAARARLMLR